MFKRGWVIISVYEWVKDKNSIQFLNGIIIEKKGKKNKRTKCTMESVIFNGKKKEGVDKIHR